MFWLSDTETEHWPNSVGVLILLIMPSTMSLFGCANKAIFAICFICVNALSQAASRMPISVLVAFSGASKSLIFWRYVSSFALKSLTSRSYNFRETSSWTPCSPTQMGEPAVGVPNFWICCATVSPGRTKYVRLFTMTCLDPLARPPPFPCPTPFFAFLAFLGLRFFGRGTCYRIKTPKIKIEATHDMLIEFYFSKSMRHLSTSGQVNNSKSKQITNLPSWLLVIDDLKFLLAFWKQMLQMSWKISSNFAFHFYDSSTAPTCTRQGLRNFTKQLQLFINSFSFVDAHLFSWLRKLTQKLFRENWFEVVFNNRESIFRSVTPFLQYIPKKDGIWDSFSCSL